MVDAQIPRLARKTTALIALIGAGVFLWAIIWRADDLPSRLLCLGAVVAIVVRFTRILSAAAARSWQNSNCAPNIHHARL